MNKTKIVQMKTIKQQITSNEQKSIIDTKKFK